MKYLPYILFLFSLFSFGQKELKIDSLIAELENTTDFVKKANINLKIAKIIENKDRDSSKVFAKEAVKNAITIKNNELLSKANLQLGVLYYKQKKDKTALQYLNKVDSIYQLDNKTVEQLIMSKIYRAEISKFTFTMPGILQAKEYILEALDYAKNNKNEKYINLVEYRLGEWHGFMSQAESPKQHLDTANIYMKKVLKYYQEQNDYEFIARVYYTMASIDISLKDYISAEVNYKKRLEVIKKSTDSVRIAEAYYGLGSVFKRLKKPNKGLKYLDSASAIFKKSGFSSDGRRKNLYRDYAYLYELKKDYKKAFINMQRAIVFKDTLYEERNNKIAMELEAKYLNKEKRQQIALLNQQKKNQKNKFLAGLVLTSLTGLFFFFQFRNRQKTTKKLKELDTAKSNFFMNISHEFRTPLTLISSPIQKQLKKPDLPKEERSNLLMMQRNSNRLLFLVDQLLDISKLESGSLKLKVSKVKIMPFIGNLIDGFSFKAKQKNIDLIVNANNTTNNTWIDKDAIEKMVTNLLSNAIKYTPEKGTIICNVFIKDDKLVFEIKNSGKGLTEKELKKVFKRFYQTDNDTEGVGIGLALVKELVTLHKGKITVASNLNEWTTFKIVLPINKASFKEDEIVLKTANLEQDFIIQENTSIIENKESTDLNSEKPILLIVEDNTDVRTYVSSIFSETYSIIQAKNGQEGIDLAIEHIPDIIISDIMMPIKNGIALCNTLKVDERTSHIPIILLTAKAGEENEIEGIKTGADDYITKPFNDDLLLLKVNKLIEVRKKLQERYSQEVVLRPKDIAISNIDENFLNKVQIILDDNLIESSFNIKNFSKAVGMSRMQLHRKLKALTGLSASEFIRLQRLKLAAKLLEKSDINVSQIGYSVGFNNHAYFSKCFKEVYNCTPTEYANSKN